MLSLQRILYIFLFAFCLPHGTSAQEEVNIDSLRTVWINESAPDSSRYQAIDDYYGTYIYSYPDSVIQLSEFHMEFAKQKNNKPEMAKALNNKGIAFYVLGELDQSLAIMNGALEIVKELNDTIALVRQYANIGNICRDKSDYQEAIRLYSLSYELFKQKKQRLREADMLNNLGLVYFDIHEYGLALDYLIQALNLYTELGIEEKTGNIWLNIAAVNLEQQNLEMALGNAHKAMVILETNQNLLSLSDCKLIVGSIHHALNNQDSALFYAEESIRMQAEIGNVDRTISSNIFKAELLVATDVQKASQMGEELLENKASLNYRKQRDVFKLLYECYKKQGRFSEAIIMNEQFRAMEDSTREEEVRIAIVRQTIQKDFEAQLFVSNLESEKAQAALKLKQVRKTYAIIFVSLLIIVSIIFYARIRFLKQRKLQEELLAEVEKLKQSNGSKGESFSEPFKLHRSKIEEAIGKSINETDWQVLNVLLDDPVTSNKDIAEKVFKSVDGVGSSLRRMYIAFDIKDSKYKKISLITKAAKISSD